MFEPRHGRSSHWYGAGGRSPRGRAGSGRCTGTRAIVERYPGRTVRALEEGCHRSASPDATTPRCPAIRRRCSRLVLGPTTGWTTSTLRSRSSSQVLIQDLELNAAPADLRASMFRALALIGGRRRSSPSTARSRRSSIAVDGLRRPSSRRCRSTPRRAWWWRAASRRGLGEQLIPDSVPDSRVTTTRLCRWSTLRRRSACRLRSDAGVGLAALGRAMRSAAHVGVEIAKRSSAYQPTSRHLAVGRERLAVEPRAAEGEVEVIALVAVART